MTLKEITRSLNLLDEEDTIYAAEPWHENSDALVAREPQEGGLPAAAAEQGLKYFLEVAIAQDFLRGWKSNLGAEPALEQQTVRYALTDA